MGTVALPKVSLAVVESTDQALVLSTVLLGTQVLVGVLSRRSSDLWLQSAVLPQASVARQVRVASKVLPQCPARLLPMPSVGMVAQAEVSLAMGASKNQALVYSTVLLGTHVMVGLVWCCTSTCWLCC